MAYKQRVIRFCMILLSVIASKTFPDTLPKEQSVLFVYDIVDEQSTFFINSFRDALKDLPLTVDEAAVQNPVTKDVSSYDAIVIYSRIMAFDMKSPVRKWVAGQKTFNAKKVSLFVTANRWFFESHYTKLLGMLKKRDANIIDAVTMATKDMSDTEKREKIRGHLVIITK